MRLLPTKPLGGALCAAFAANFVLASAPAHAQSFPCFEPDTMASARIHDLRVHLMVNALKCREVAPMTLRNYGQLLNSRSTEFARHGRTVKASLETRYGSRQGTQMFDEYETQLGNYHSGVKPSRQQCEDTAAFIRLAHRAGDQELETLSQLVTNRGIRACAVPQERVAIAPPAPMPAPARAMDARWTEPVAPAPAPRVAPRPAPRMVDGIETYAPGMGPNTAPEPLERVAPPAPVTVAEAAPAAPSRDDQLAQAISALDAAAAALRGMQEDAPGGAR